MTKLIFPAVLLCLLMVGCILLDPDSGPTIIKYEVTGTASSVYITMHNESSSLEELSDISIPWAKELIVKPTRDYTFEDAGCAHFSYLSAKNNGDSGSITAKIYKNNEEIRTATSSGAGVTAVVEARIDMYCN